jgi:hypothetical protein
MLVLDNEARIAHTVRCDACGKMRIGCGQRACAEQRKRRAKKEHPKVLSIVEIMKNS